LVAPAPPLPACAPQSDAPLVLLQPGSSDPRRCWPPASFAAVGDALAAMGARIAVNGTSEEAPLVRRVVRAMRHPAIDLSGKLDLGGLCGLIEGAACVVSNDTGPLHLALAIGTPCVGIFWLTNLIDGAPLRPSLLRAALSLRQDCPVCGLPNLRQRCSHEASFVADVPVEQVIRMAQEVLGVAPV
jgi:ADP-heptose:LPS heptosyltransferase